MQGAETGDALIDAQAQTRWGVWRSSSRPGTPLGVPGRELFGRSGTAVWRVRPQAVEFTPKHPWA